MAVFAFQYKVLSVLPGSGMGIAVSTPSTQKVSAWQMTSPPSPSVTRDLSEPPWDVVSVWVEAPFSLSVGTCYMESRFRKVSLGRHRSYRIDRLVGPRGNGSCILPRRKGRVLFSAGAFQVRGVCGHLSLPGCCPDLTGSILAPAWR